MKRLRSVPLLAVVVAVAAAAQAVAGTNAPPRLQVTPARGHAHTTFTVHFTAPAPSGRSGGQIRRYALSAAPARSSASRRPSRGCIDNVGMSPQADHAGQAMAVALDPRALGGRWCTGTYTGEVNEISGPACGPPTYMRDAIVCPEYVSIVGRIGTFSFRVRR